MNNVLKRRMRAKVLVTTKSHGSFEGVLWDVDREALVLRQAVQIGDNAKPVAAVDGELLIFVADVAYIQIV